MQTEAILLLMALLVIYFVWRQLSSRGDLSHECFSISVMRVNILTSYEYRNSIFKEKRKWQLYVLSRKETRRMAQCKA